MIEEKFVIKVIHADSSIGYVVKEQPRFYATSLLTASSFDTKAEAYNEINNVCNEGIYQILPMIIKK